MLNLSQGRVITFVMLKHTVNPKILKEIVISIVSGRLVESHSRPSIRKLWELNNGEACLIHWQYPAIVSGLQEPETRTPISDPPATAWWY